MNINIYNAVVALLNADMTLSTQDRKKILAVCKHPDVFCQPEERKLPRLLTIMETAKLLSVSRTTLWRMTLDGDIPAIRFRHTGTSRYNLDDIEAFIRGERAEPGECKEKGSSRQARNSKENEGFEDAIEV